MKKLILAASLVIPISLFAQLDVGGGLLENCADIDSLQGSGNFAEARDKARLCLEGIEQELSGEIAQFFLEDIAGWTRQSIEQSQMMGFTNITAVYQKGGATVSVSLTGASGGGSASGLGGLLGGLGGLGGLAQSALGQSGQQVTVAGIASTFGADGTLTIPLEDGSLLAFDSPNFNNPDQAISGMGDLINDFPVADINAALL